MGQSDELLFGYKIDFSSSPPTYAGGDAFVLSLDYMMMCLAVL